MKIGKVLKALCFLLILGLMLAVLELNKNTVAGWALTLAAAAGYLLLRRKTARAGRGALRFLCSAGWILCFTGILVLTWPPVKRVPAVEGKNGGPTEIVALRDGDVRGVRTADGAVEVFAGIPYAAPPVGELRWREPADPEPWEGVLEADSFAPMSMQPVNLPLYDSLVQIIGYHDYKISLRDNYRPPVSEDALYVNVWRPAERPESGLPVLVYIHGGSLQTGQPWYGDYSGEGLAREGVIVVNMGYRLGVFGYLALKELAAESEHGTTGNYGLLDQIKALEWVRDNIAAFGGDPGNVTLAGESAGSASVSALCTSPLASGLFRRAILESSTLASVKPPHSFRLFGEALASGAELMERHGVSSAAELRSLSAEALADEAYTQHHITVDGYALTMTPHESYRAGIHNEEAVLHGYNLHESGAFLVFDHTDRNGFDKRVRDYFGEYAEEVFALYPVSSDEEADEAWREIWGAVFFDYPHYCLNRLAVANGIPVWEYLFSKDNGRLGSWHSGEEVYFYGNVPKPGTSRVYDDSDWVLGSVAKTRFRNFITRGNPNDIGEEEFLEGWAQNLTSEDLMEFGERDGAASARMTKEWKLPLYEIFDRMDGWEA